MRPAGDESGQRRHGLRRFSRRLRPLSRRGKQKLDVCSRRRRCSGWVTAGKEDNIWSIQTTPIGVALGTTCRTVSGMTDALDGPPSERRLSGTEVVELQRTIEAGLLAQEARMSGVGFADATHQELRILQDQGELARQRFIKANLGLVGMITRQHAARSQLPEAELFQEGCVGLITAVERFDYARGHRFSTYGLFWIRAYVNAATARLLGAMNLPTSRAEQLRAAHGIETQLTQSLGRSPTLSELADALGRSEDWTAGLLSHQRPRSLELVDGATLERLQAHDELDAVLAEPSQLHELLSRLGDLDRRVLELRLGFADGEAKTYAHTARVLDISVTRVRRIEARALETLREFCPQQASAQL
jgi:RNA polymerase primary sigma factor